MSEIDQPVPIMNHSEDNWGLINDYIGFIK